MTVGITPLMSTIDYWYHGGGEAAAVWCRAKLSHFQWGGASEYAEAVVLNRAPGTHFPTFMVQSSCRT